MSIRGKLLAVHFYLAFLGTAYILYKKGEVLSNTTSLVYEASLLLTGLSIWFVWSWKKLTGNWFDPYVVFLIAACLFNGGHAYLEVFGLNKSGILDSRFSPATSLNTLLLVILGLSCFHFGAMAAVKSTTNNRNFPNAVGAPLSSVNSRGQHGQVRYSAVDLQLLGWILIIISIVPNIIQLGEAIRIAQQYSYSALYQREAATSLDAAPKILAQLIIPGGMFLLVGSKHSRVNLAIAVTSILIYSSLTILTGYRGWGVLPLIAGAWLWHRVIHPIPRVALFGGAAIILFVIFPTIRIVRGIQGEAKSSAFMETFLTIENPVTAIVSEMGGSMKTISYTLELVPEYREYDRGAGYAYALSTVIPNFFGDLHPAVKRVLPGKWLTETVNPYIAKRGGGLGYSFIAEAYLNFSWYGVLALGGIGWAFGKIMRWGDRVSDVAKMAMIATFTSFLSMYARGDATMVVRALVWYSWLPYLLVRVIAAISRRIDMFRVSTPQQLPY